MAARIKMQTSKGQNRICEGKAFYFFLCFYLLPIHATCGFNFDFYCDSTSSPTFEHVFSASISSTMYYHIFCLLCILLMLFSWSSSSNQILPVGCIHSKHRCSPQKTKELELPSASALCLSKIHCFSWMFFFRYTKTNLHLLMFTNPDCGRLIPRKLIVAFIHNS